ncbi:MAG: BamA/TamA family outer membrane protein, partial [Kofleriaceae bacterium]|nr:BamA/TamA family outer membrane protein [Kofleriaceae bacterium]
DGAIAYGVELGDVTEPLGVYGQAKLSVVKSSVLGLDARITARLTHSLFPKAAVREYSAGPGFRKALADKLYLDGQILAYTAQETEALALSSVDRASVGLSEKVESAGTKLQTEIVWDNRDSGIEAMHGSFASLHLEYAPDVLGASHEWLSLKTDLRGFRSLSPSLSLALRAAGSWVLGDGDAGIPLHRRLFGGGAYGFRGFGRQHLSPELNGLLVGGKSMVEGSVEARFLPLRLLYGAVAFVDVGANSVDNNPFANGVYAAVGVGARLRTFYIPVSFDLSYRVLDESALISPLQGEPWSFFVRLGEAF